tara:strand:+ start:309 stop:746 length:438 start_codon:yes stop_codon:yes gene_type:complete
MKKFITLVLLSPVIVSSELSTFDEFFSSEKANAMSSHELTIYSLEKCSALSFISIGGDNPDVYDLGDYFLEISLAYKIEEESEINEEVHQENTLQTIQVYFKEYEAHINEYLKTEPDQPFSELMREDLEFCMYVYEVISGETGED